MSAYPMAAADPFDFVATYFEGPISLEEDWTLLSTHPGMQPTTASYGVPPPTEEDWKSSIPPGIKFRPTDVELIVNYLQVEYLHGYIQSGIITYATIYDYEHDQLQALTVDHGDGKLYFFTRIKKIGKSKTERSVKSKNGYWKATQALKPIKGESGDPIGYKRPLTYIQNKHSSEELALVVVYHHRTKRNDGNED